MWPGSQYWSGAPPRAELHVNSSGQGRAGQAAGSPRWWEGRGQPDFSLPPSDNTLFPRGQAACQGEGVSLWGSKSREDRGLGWGRQAWPVSSHIGPVRAGAEAMGSPGGPPCRLAPLASNPAAVVVRCSL